MNNQEIRQLRAKLASFPPYDWEDDVEALLNNLEQAQAHRDQYLADYTAELDGGRKMRKMLGALPGETLFQCVERVMSELKDATWRATVNNNLYVMTEKYHNEDLIWMEKIIAAARSAVSGPDSTNYARLAGVLDEYERWRKGLVNVAASVSKEETQ